ncbi:hypothetical protein ALC56_11979 [Trachymyrmex septentrionalis]|uniref:Uncharacterized protein n=1 Tax=Trachymyrmex septentrionalis TaxID=34720 RepID=A0A195F038_9HYME|nr:hypothetical protein ALC56_11979 [Trachymyrmex septentrionalis]
MGELSCNEVLTSFGLVPNDALEGDGGTGLAGPQTLRFRNGPHAGPNAYVGHVLQQKVRRTIENRKGAERRRRRSGSMNGEKIGGREKLQTLGRTPVKVKSCFSTDEIPIRLLEYRKPFFRCESRSIGSNQARSWWLDEAKRAHTDEQALSLIARLPYNERKRALLSPYLAFKFPSDFRYRYSI